jgi:hypothetical protein
MIFSMFLPPTMTIESSTGLHLMNFACPGEFLCDARAEVTVPALSNLKIEMKASGSCERTASPADFVVKHMSPTLWTANSCGRVKVLNFFKLSKS